MRSFQSGKYLLQVLPRAAPRSVWRIFEAFISCDCCLIVSEPSQAVRLQPKPRFQSAPGQTLALAESAILRISSAIAESSGIATLTLTKPKSFASICMRSDGTTK